MVQIKQVAEDLEQAVKMVNLLLHVNVAIVFISFSVLHGLDCLLILCFNLAEYLLQLVEVEAAPGLQLFVVAIAQVRAAIRCALVVVFFLAKDSISNVPSYVCISRVEVIDQISQVFLCW